MAEDTGQGDRTETATPRRLSRAREQGNVPLSRELSLLTGLVAATLVLASAGPQIAHTLAVRLSVFLAQAHTPGWPAARGCIAPSSPWPEPPLPSCSPCCSPAR